MRAVLFCNEMLGLGHLRRSLAIAEALLRIEPGSSATVVTGSPAWERVEIPAGVEVVKLPTAPPDRASAWRATGRLPEGVAGLDDAAEVYEARSRRARATVEAVRPDVVLVDYLPFGREDDLRPALAAANGATIGLGIWDVDDAPERLRERWTVAHAEDVARTFHLALVYGEPDPDDVRTTLLRQAGVPTRITAIVSGAPATVGAADLGEGYLLAIAGGGADGFPLLDTLLDALTERPLEVPAVFVTGPLMPHAESMRLRARVQSLDVRVFEHRSDMSAVIAGARGVVAMGGYCTVAELLAQGRPALLVPRAHPRAEQLNRASRLAASGRALMLHPGDLTPAALREALDALLARKPRQPQALEGASQAAAILAAARR